MLIFLVAISTIAVLVFVESQHSVMRRRLRARSENRPQTPTARRRRRH